MRGTPTTCLETFPLPWPPGKEPVGDPLFRAIAEAAQELNELRERALNSDPLAEPEELKKLTLTSLYNRMKAGELTWLANAHEKLDRAVFAAYEWEYPMEDRGSFAIAGGELEASSGTKRLTRVSHRVGLTPLDPSRGGCDSQLSGCAGSRHGGRSDISLASACPWASVLAAGRNRDVRAQGFARFRTSS